MYHAGGLQPFVAVNFVIADDVTHTVGKDFRTTAGHGVDTGLFEPVEGLGDG